MRMYKFWSNMKFWYSAGYFTALTAAYLYQCWRLHRKRQCMMCKLYFYKNSVDICRRCSWRPLLDHSKAFSNLFPVNNLFPVSYE
jgi:hypothetical protein